MSQDTPAEDEVVESTVLDSPLDETSVDDFSDSNDQEVETDSQTETSQDENSQTDETSPQVNPRSENRYQKMASDNKELRRQLEELQARQAQFATEEGLLNQINPDTGDLYTPQEIERISWQSSREAQAERNSQEMYNLQVQQNQNQLSIEAVKAVEQFSVLDSNSKDFNPAISAQFDELLGDNLIYAMPDGSTYSGSVLRANGIDPSTQTLVGANLSPYKLAKTIADAYNGAKSQGEVIGQANSRRAAERMMSNVDVVGGNGKDSGEDAIFNRVKDFPLS